MEVSEGETGRTRQGNVGGKKKKGSVRREIGMDGRGGRGGNG